jgi:FkbM family methyltransferase
VRRLVAASVEPRVAAASARWWVEIRMQLVRRELARFAALDERLPWWPWLQLCGWNAEAVAKAIGRLAPNGLRFVQIGANDGSFLDPLSQTVRRNNWQGVLVEPIPWIYERLVDNYSGTEGLTFVNAAIADEDGTLPMYFVERRLGDPEFFDALFTFDVEVLRSHRNTRPDFDDRVRTTEVKALTLLSLLRETSTKRIDLLHIDAEGYDFEILKQIDFDAAWAPRFILFEIKHLDVRALRDVRSMLKRAGYRWFPIWHDAFAYRGAP